MSATNNERAGSVLARMRSGTAVLGDTQHLPGYCVLLSNVDSADHLTDLPRPARVAFLADMAMLGEAVLIACRAADPGFLRVNYEILGNFVHRLHGHVHARYEWEPEEYRTGPVWRYPNDVRTAPEHTLGPAHDKLRDTIATELEAIMAQEYG